MENNQNKQEKLESVNIDKPIEKKEEDLFSRNSVGGKIKCRKRKIKCRIFATNYLSFNLKLKL